MPRDETMMTPREVAARLKVSVNTLAYWRRTGTGPPAYKVGNSVRYRPSEVDAWVSAQQTTPEDEAGEPEQPAA